MRPLFHGLSPPRRSLQLFQSDRMKESTLLSSDCPHFVDTCLIQDTFLFCLHSSDFFLMQVVKYIFSVRRIATELFHNAPPFYATSSCPKPYNFDGIDIKIST